MTIHSTEAQAEGQEEEEVEQEQEEEEQEESEVKKLDKFATLIDNKRESSQSEYSSAIEEDKPKKSNIEKEPSLGDIIFKEEEQKETLTNYNFSKKRMGVCDNIYKRIGWGIFALGIILTSCVLIGVSLKKLKSTEYGIEYDVLTKQLDDAAKTGGLHAGPPGFEFIKFPSTYITVDLNNGICVSQDGLRVEFSVTFQYQITEEWLKPAILKYRNYQTWSGMVKAAGQSAVQHSCSEYTISNFQNKRGIIQSKMQQNLQLKLSGDPQGDGSDGVYARAVSLQLRNVELPTLYQEAVRDKQSAAEDIALAENQRTQELTKARTALLAAKEEARKIRDNAENDANVTITEARLRAEEILFSYEQEGVVLRGVKEGLNLTTGGVLGYVSNRLYESVGDLRVSTGEPARISRKDEL